MNFLYQLISRQIKIHFLLHFVILTDRFQVFFSVPSLFFSLLHSKPKIWTCTTAMNCHRKNKKKQMIFIVCGITWQIDLKKRINFTPLGSDFNENLSIGLFYLAKPLVQIKIFCVKYFLSYGGSNFFLWKLYPTAELKPQNHKALGGAGTKAK